MNLGEKNEKILTRNDTRKQKMNVSNHGTELETPICGEIANKHIDE